MRGSRRKQEANDKATAGRPSRPLKRRRGRGKQIEKERVKEEIQRQPVDDIRFNKKIMNNLEKSGAVNYLLAKMFTQLSIYANQRQRKKFLIASDYKTFINSRKNDHDNDYSDDYNDDDVQERNRIMHLIASRIVYEYLIDHRLKLTTNALQNETRNDKAFSSNTPASFSPLKLDEDEGDDEENNNQENDIIKKIILANKKTELTMKPPVRRHKKDEEILFNVPKQKTSHLKRKNSLNSDFSLASINSSLVKTDETSESDQDPSSEKYDDLDEGEEYDPKEEKSDNNEESRPQPSTPPKSPESPRRKPAPPLPSTTSPKRQASTSIKLTSPSKTTTPSKFVNNDTFSSDDDGSEHLYSSSNIEIDDNDLPDSMKIYNPQTPSHAKNEITSVDLSVNSTDLNFISIPNFNPATKSTFSHAVEELKVTHPNNLSDEDSLNDTSGSEHELEAEDEYFSEKNE